jgi:hypothetical protein
MFSCAYQTDKAGLTVSDGMIGLGTRYKARAQDNYDNRIQKLI